MYDAGVAMGAGTVAGTTVAVTMLPNTGGELLVQFGVAIAAGLVAWGVLYARKQKRAMESLV